MAPQAMAAEKIIYSTPPHKSLSASDRLGLSEYTQQTLQKSLDEFEIAAIDLNEDGLNEFALKPLECSKTEALCPHYLIAKTKGRTIISLGFIEAQSLVLGNAYTQGVRNIMAFNNTTNDFEYSLFLWDPENASYAKKDHL